MIRLKNSLHHWGSPSFEGVLKEEVSLLDAGVLPLQAGLSQGSHVSDSAIKVILLGVTEDPDTLRVKTGIFYSSIISGCSCADDPTPVDELTEYCEIQFDVDKASAETTITLLPEMAQ